MNAAVRVLLVVHGIAHVVGFVVPWRLVTAPDVPHRTTVMSGWVDVGDNGIRAVGVVWLLLALVVVVVGVALLAGIWSYPVAMWVLVASLALCLPDARIGLVLDIVLLIVLTGVNHFRWLART
jgi:hypothetical protein